MANKKQQDPLGAGPGGFNLGRIHRNPPFTLKVREGAHGSAWVGAGQAPHRRTPAKVNTKVLMGGEALDSWQYPPPPHTWATPAAHKGEVHTCTSCGDSCSPRRHLCAHPSLSALPYLKNIDLLGRQSNRERARERPSVGSFPEVAATAGAGPGRSQELHPGLPCASAGSWIGSGVARTPTKPSDVGGGHPKQWLNPWRHETPHPPLWPCI